VKEEDMADEKIPVVILGAGGYAIVIHEILNNRPDVLLIGCTDKALGISERSIDEGVTLRILGDDDILPQLADQYPGLHAVLALGPDLMDVRARLIRRLDLEKIPSITVVHQSAIVAPLAKLGEGTVVRGGAVVSAGSQIGRFGLVNLGASIDLDANLATNVYVGQGAQISSHVQVGDNVVIEMGASINSRVTIGEGARVTGGAFVNTDVPDHAVVVGVPARVVRYLNPL
jgi:sugar O-acyltransferase (sialic acid O-acetyltransferase NeuD family)